jgi:hypothetical protein
MQNKIDLVKESQAKEQYDQIIKFVQGLHFHHLQGFHAAEYLGCKPVMQH